jgi:hypothetical protein
VVFPACQPKVHSKNVGKGPDLHTKFEGKNKKEGCRNEGLKPSVGGKDFSSPPQNPLVKGKALWLLHLVRGISIFTQFGDEAARMATSDAGSTKGGKVGAVLALV